MSHDKTKYLGNKFIIVSHKDNDSVTSALIGLVVKIEERYEGLRVAHKTGRRPFVYYGTIESEGPFYGRKYGFSKNELKEL